MSGEAEKTERAYVYMVRCAGGQLYTGWTNDPASRLHAHKSGKGAKCTRALGAQRFAYLERCTDRSAALRREAALKKLTKPQKEALCAEWAEKNLPRLSLATRADAAEILDIYNWYVLHHTATFQVTPSSLPEYEDWVDSTRALIPLLLARDGDGKLLGYACAHRYHPGKPTTGLWRAPSTVPPMPGALVWGIPSTAPCWIFWTGWVTGMSTPLWQTPTPPVSVSMPAWASPAWAVSPTLPISSAGWACPPGGCPCAGAMKSRSPPTR